MRGVVVWMVGAVLLATSVAGASEGARQLTDDELRSEITQNRKLAAYVARNGLPDVAEWRFLADQGPWDNHEVTIYYLEAHKEISFARAWILGEPSIHLLRYERELSDQDVAALEPLVRPRGSKSRRSRGSGPAARAEAAAERAEAAAARVDAAAQVAERAADRAEAVFAKLEDAVLRRFRK